MSSKDSFNGSPYSGVGSSGYNSISGSNFTKASPSPYVTSSTEYFESTTLTNNNNNSNAYQSNNSASFDLSKTENIASSLIHDEALAQEVLSKAGPAFTYQRKDYSHDIGALTSDSNATNSYNDLNSLKSQYYSSEYDYDGNSNIIKLNSPKAHHSGSAINQDPDPIRIVKPNNQNIVYKQHVNIRYLQPPTPPPPAPIIIREKQIAAQPSQPPIIIRQTAPAPPTPPPLTIREKAPTPPPVLEPTIIERPVPPPPAPPRQVIIERVPAAPAKPRSIIYEKWLPYKSTKRQVIVQKIKPVAPLPPPKNVIIEYEKPKAVAVRQVVEEGVFRADPSTYQSQSLSTGEVRFVERITDLPLQNSQILAQLSLEQKTSSVNQEISIEDSDELYAKLLSSSSSIDNSSHSKDSNYFSSFTQYNNNNNYAQNVEYETITTTVPESLAAKIIAEAQAAGAILRSSTGSVNKTSASGFN